MPRILLVLALQACAPSHALRTHQEPPTWKYAADFAAMTAGMWACVDGYNRGDDTEAALGCGAFLMIWTPYWVWP